MKHKCDKSTHFYFEEYETTLGPLREKPINILEVGIWKGLSMQAWHEYFPNARLYGLDIFTRVKSEEVPILQKDRVFYAKCDSTNPVDVKKAMDKFNVKFDVIIDDGLHNPLANLKTFENLIEYLNDGGIYYVEDAWPLDIMDQKALNHTWLKRSPHLYNKENMDLFLNAISKYQVTRIDTRQKSKNPDSYMFRIVK